MTTSTRSMFDTADWIAALDGTLAAPPAPPPAVDDEPIIGDSPPYRVRPAGDSPAVAPRRLRNLPWAVLATVLALALPVGLYLVGWASLELAGIGAGVMLLELVIWLILARRFGNL